MKLNVVMFPPAQRYDCAMEIFDFYYAYRQYRNRDLNYCANLEINFSQDIKIDQNAINIAWYYMPEHIESYEKFDIVIVDNSQHHLEVATGAMLEAVRDMPNCYFTSGSLVETSYQHFDKIITSPMIYRTREYFTRPYYPQYYQNLEESHQPRRPLFFINGQNRRNRQYFYELLKEALGSKIDYWGNDFYPDSKLLDSCFQIEADTEFRIFLNEKKFVEDIWESVQKNYYDKSIKIGIEKRFGLIAPGFLLLDQYFQYHCVVFPETSWLNDEIFVTEKIIKCFISKAIPFPIGGANTNKLYNQLGYKTAWNLLPEHLQLFDEEKNHVMRYNKKVQALEWLADNSAVFESPLAQQIKNQNYMNFFTQKDDFIGVKKLDQILEKYKK